MSARWMTAATLGVVAVDAVLLATGVISWPVALVLIVVVEVPLAAVSIARLVRRYRRALRDPADVNADAGARGRRRAALVVVVEEDLLLRVAAGELRLFASLGRWILRRPDIPAGAEGVGYARGALAVPGAFAVAGVIEMVVVHLLVPWPVARLVLGLLGLYGVLIVLGWMGALVTRPHLKYPDRLVLRHGNTRIATIDLAAVASVSHARSMATPKDYVTTAHDGGRALTLAGPDGTNILIEMRRSVQVRTPGMPWTHNRVHEVDRMRLHVDEPRALDGLADTEAAPHGAGESARGRSGMLRPASYEPSGGTNPRTREPRG